jgi:hypothetical protein
MEEGSIMLSVGDIVKYWISDKHNPAKYGIIENIAINEYNTNNCWVRWFRSDALVSYRSYELIKVENNA